MRLVGLTGNIGSGKSTVARLFSLLDIPIYHADARAKTFLEHEQVKKQITECFGREVLNNQSAIDRKKLAALVFNHTDSLRKLNNIIHPLVREDFRNWVKSCEKSPYVLQEAAILIESGQHLCFDRIILVAAPEALCIARVCSRDEVSPEDVKQRARHQLGEQEKRLIADYVIENDGQRLLLPQVNNIHQMLLEDAGCFGMHQSF